MSTEKPDNSGSGKSREGGAGHTLETLSQKLGRKPTVAEIEDAIAAGKQPRLKPDGTLETMDSRVGNLETLLDNRSAELAEAKQEIQRLEGVVVEYHDDHNERMEHIQGLEAKLADERQVAQGRIQDLEERQLLFGVPEADVQLTVRALAVQSLRSPGLEPASRLIVKGIDREKMFDQLRQSLEDVEPPADRGI